MNKKKSIFKYKKWYHKKKPALKKEGIKNNKRSRKITTCQNINKLENNIIKLNKNNLENHDKDVNYQNGLKNNKNKLENQSHSSDIQIIDSDFPSWFK